MESHLGPEAARQTQIIILPPPNTLLGVVMEMDPQTHSRVRVSCEDLFTE